MAIAALRAIPRRVLAAGAIDWIAIAVIGAIGAGLDSVRPHHRRFSLADASLAYPYEKDNIPTWLLVVCSMCIPAVIIPVVVAIAVPGSTTTRRLGSKRVRGRKIWELHAGWVGLGLSLATAFTITQAGKVMFSRPRPNLIARCNPDPEVLAAARASAGAWELVDSSICRPRSANFLNEGFRSFPSGHSSLAWSGLFYLTLFLCAKLRVFIPALPPRPFSPYTFEDALESNKEPAGEPLPSVRYSALSKEADAPPKAYTLLHRPAAENPAVSIPLDVPLRSQGANPPTLLLVVVALPSAAAMYIASTRYTLGYHFGLDILAGSLLGIGSAWLGFRWHHLPLSHGAGWAWGPRSSSCAFGIGVGATRYVDYAGDEPTPPTAPPASPLPAPLRLSALTRADSGVHPAFRDPRLEVPVPPSPRGRRLSVAQSTRNSVMVDGSVGHLPLQPPGPVQFQGHTRAHSSPGLAAVPPPAALVPPQRVSVVSFDSAGSASGSAPASGGLNERG